MALVVSKNVIQFSICMLILYDFSFICLGLLVSILELLKLLDLKLLFLRLSNWWSLQKISCISFKYHLICSLCSYDYSEKISVKLKKKLVMIHNVNQGPELGQRNELLHNYLITWLHTLYYVIITICNYIYDMIWFVESSISIMYNQYNLPSYFELFLLRFGYLIMGLQLYAY